METNRRFSVGLGAPLALAASCLVTLGCGGPVGNDVSGSVTFDGKPVPAGKIYFMPDSAKGNSGASGFADIVNGRYDTAAGGRGAPPGAVIITVEGSDPAGAAGGSPDVGAKTLFSNYETTADLPEGASTKDIVVPAEAAKPKTFSDAPGSGKGGIVTP